MKVLPLILFRRRVDHFLAAPPMKLLPLNGPSVTLNHHPVVRLRRWFFVSCSSTTMIPLWTVLRWRWPTMKLLACNGDHSSTPVEMSTTRHSDSVRYSRKTHFLQLPNRQTPYYIWLFIEYIYKLITTKTKKTIHKYLRTEKIRSSTRRYNSIYVKSFLNLLPDDSAFYYRSISRHSAIPFFLLHLTPLPHHFLFLLSSTLNYLQPLSTRSQFVFDCPVTFLPGEPITIFFSWDTLNVSSHTRVPPEYTRF